MIAIPTLSLALTALFAPVQDAPAAPAGDLTMLRLYEGAILWGRIESHDAAGLSFARLDNGGRVRVPWSRLDPAQSETMQEDFGYIDHTGEELMIEADRLVLDNGIEWVGRIVNNTPDELWIKTASALVQVPKLRLRGAATVVQVPALDVYTGEELYQQEFARHDATSARSHYDLALFCERILEFERSLEHFASVSELDPAFDPDEVAARVARITIKAKNKEQIQYLRAIDTLRGRGKYDQAIANAEAFGELYPESALAPDAVRKRLQVEKAREKALRERTVRGWHQWANRLTRNKGRDPEISLESALAWLDDGLREELITALHAELSRTTSASVSPEQIQLFWNERGSSVRPHKASYGGGTWLLGADGARAGIPEQARDTSDMNEKEKERARLEERVKRYLSNQSTVRKNKIEGDGESEQSKFWSHMGGASKALWMLAYYVEKGSDMRIIRVLTSNCTDCNGTGVREVVSINTAASRPSQQGGQNRTEMVACPLCHNVGVVRRVVYR